MEHETVNIESKYVSLIELDPEEKLVCIIKRHVIGLVGVFVTGIFIALVVLFAAVYSSVWLYTRGASIAPGRTYPMIVAIIGVVFAALVIFFTYVAAYVYKNSVIIVTSDKVAQVLYKNLVDRKISQLSLGDLQDITVDQRGLLARIFKYGTLIIETAGEQNNFIFTFTPFPHSCARDIVAAREASIKKYGN